ncbi:MAG: CD225/dispanin family protein [Bacteroidales bacterium]|nr:CD225/dispanin family protein [Bacteroidales bacterium]
METVPFHSNRLVMAILCTLFCCQIGGIIAIVYSARSNSTYRSAMFSPNDATRQSLYYQSEQENKTARTWIIVSVCSGLAGVIAYIVLATLGFIASVW